MQKREKGITLIALVITVIVLIILAGISITTLTGEKGLINQTRNNSEEAQRESIIEKIEADLLKEKTKTGNTPSKDDLKTIIQENGYNEGTLGENNFVSKDGGYTIEYSQIIGWEDYKTISDLKVGDFVNYIDKNGTTIECIVLYDTEYNETNNTDYGIQIISKDKVDTVTLGEDASTDESIDAYNNAINILNGKAEEYLNRTYASDARCVGSVPSNKNSEAEDNFKSNYEYMELFNNRLKNSDTNCEIDYNQMEKYNMTNITSNGDYWLASRFINSNNNTTEFYIRYIENSVEPSYIGGFFICNFGDFWYSSYGYTRGLRVVFTLKDELKIIEGNGIDKPYVLSS